jgi:hypothetical protein
MIIKKSLNYAIAYALWFVTILLGLWFALLARTDFQGAMTTFYIRGSIMYLERARFFEEIFVLVMGLLWLALVVITEWYFRSGARRPDLLKRFARVAGPVILLVFVADLFLFWLQGVSSGNWLRWLILAGELALGIVFLLYARSPSLPDQTKRKLN